MRLHSFLLIIALRRLEISIINYYGLQSANQHVLMINSYIINSAPPREVDMEDIKISVEISFSNDI